MSDYAYVNKVKIVMSKAKGRKGREGETNTEGAGVRLEGEKGTGGDGEG